MQWMDIPCMCVILFKEMNGTTHSKMVCKVQGMYIIVHN